MNERPILQRSTTPDHGAEFWPGLEAVISGAGEHPNQAEHPNQGIESPTRQAPPAAPGPGANSHRRSARRLWPLAAAAAVLSLVGLGLFLGRTDGPATEVVAGTGEPTTTAALDGVGTSEEAVDDAGAAGADGSSDQVASVGGADATSADATGGDAADGDGAAGAGAPTGATIAVDPAGVPAPVLPVDATELATWPEQPLGWYSIDATDQPCASQIRFVNVTGMALPIVTPQVVFTGDIARLVPSPGYRSVAILVDCDGRLELHVAQADPNQPGGFVDLGLAWVGRASSSVADLSWAGSTLTLNSLDVTGAAFFVEVDTRVGTIDGSGMVISTGDSPPAGVHPWIVGTMPASVESGSTWWNAAKPEPTSGCDGADADEGTLWHRSAAGVWIPAYAEPVDAGEIGAFAYEPIYSQVAFADSCPGINEGRFFVGTVRADGLISSVRTVDMAAFGTGHVSTLRWVDGQTLYLETDNTNTGGETLAFQWIFDDGRDGGILQQLRS